MYTTIEAEIRNGKVIGAEASVLPDNARVLITLLAAHSGKKRPDLGTKTSAEVKMSSDAFAPLSDEEIVSWGL